MHTDARTLDDQSLIEGDICIIGAGAAGISIALEFMHKPYKVILLEGGGFNYEDAMQDLYDGKTTGQPYYSLRASRLHYFGGTTGHWAGYCSTFDDIDFEQRDWVPGSGWPITRATLDPYYARAHRLAELGPYEYDLAYWQAQDPKLIPMPLDKNVVWHKIWQFSKPTHFGEKYKDPVLKAKNIHLYTYANVVNIETNQAVSAVSTVTIKNHAGKTHRVKAGIFILACCSIQNARLLLASNGQAPKGIGNDNDLVGRYFMEHLEIKSAELWLTRPLPMYIYQSGMGGIKVTTELAITAKKQAEHKMLNGTSSLSSSAFAKNVKPMIDIWSAPDSRKNWDTMIAGFKRAHALSSSATEQARDRIFQCFTRIEQAPNPLSRVTLGTERDAMGVPRANLNWALTPLEKRSIRKLYELIGQEVGRAGLGRIKMMDYLHDENDMSWPKFTGGGWHHMGTTRMSADPKKGVVDANCKVHGMANLYVAGASCFVTAAAVNPTLTLIALSLRLADHVQETKRTQKL